MIATRALGRRSAMSATTLRGVAPAASSASNTRSAGNACKNANAPSRLLVPIARWPCTAIKRASLAW
jgi:hypothetical protein